MHFTPIDLKTKEKNARQFLLLVQLKLDINMG